MVKLVLVLGDQLSPGLSALRNAEKSHDIVVMSEVLGEATYVPHHPKKIAFVFAAMRKFAAGLRAEGWRVAYGRLDDPENTQSLTGELVRRAEEFGAKEVICTQAGEWRVIEALESLPLALTSLPDDRFIASPAEFSDWANGRKQLRMEYFYREMRRKTGLLMDGAQPVGGQWNYDHENRKSASKGTHFARPLRFEPDAEVGQVLELVERRFGSNFGALHPFWFATTAAEAEAQLDHWIKTGLAGFGDLQDAMVGGEPFLNHAVISLYLNVGLLDPLAVCRAVEAAWRAGAAPINAAEGFIRQIIGWREYVRGLYFHEGPSYTQRNALGHKRDLPSVFWGGKTWMACVEAAIRQTRQEAYAHHIQRLMITGNFALLAGVEPRQVHEWYLSVYADAFEWVEAPNTVGMSQFADGGIIASKPYVSSGNYINKMSDHCKGCCYRVQDKTGPDACPFNLLYWHFLNRHVDRFSGNPRMANIYRVWERMGEDRQEQILIEANELLARLDAGEII